MASIPTQSHPAHITESFAGFYLPSSNDQDSPLRAILEDQPAGTAKLQRLRRPHKKSRRGCLNCKTRKVKVRPSPVLSVRRRLKTFSARKQGLPVQTV